jgi:hypothetical protein
MFYYNLLLMVYDHHRGHITSVVVSVITSCDSGFDSRSGQTKEYEIGICCFSAKHATLIRKSKYWLARNQANVPEWADMSIRGLLCQ